MNVYVHLCIMQISSDLCKSFPSILFRNIAFGDVLLERREEKPEEGYVLPEQGCCSNATRVERSKGDS